MEGTMTEMAVYPVESHARTWMKSISWRILGTLTTVGATFSITNNFNIATAVGAIELVAKIFLFYMHERLWIKISKVIL